MPGDDEMFIVDNPKTLRQRRALREVDTVAVSAPGVASAFVKRRATRV